MPEMKRECNNKLTLPISKHTILFHIRSPIWLVELMMEYANKKFKQSSLEQVQ